VRLIEPLVKALRVAGAGDVYRGAQLLRSLWAARCNVCLVEEYIAVFVGLPVSSRKRRLSSPAKLASVRPWGSVVQRTLFFLIPTAICLCLAATSVVLQWLISMRKSIELGRAVLSTSTANFELWLKTLITISPQQQCTNLEQRDAASILSFLSSGDVWVGRGNGLYIDLDITLSGKPLADKQLQQLSEAILEAPVSMFDAYRLSVTYKMNAGMGAAAPQAFDTLRHSS
jgi:hypothetical protein